MIVWRGVVKRDYDAEALAVAGIFDMLWVRKKEGQV
jgi:hypothetical protein